jgi:membrane associated rhomboid family serine protease
MLEYLWLATILVATWVCAYLGIVMIGSAILKYEQMTQTEDDPVSSVLAIVGTLLMGVATMFAGGIILLEVARKIGWPGAIVACVVGLVVFAPSFTKLALKTMRLRPTPRPPS